MENKEQPRLVDPGKLRTTQVLQIAPGEKKSTKAFALGQGWLGVAPSGAPAEKVGLLLNEWGSCLVSRAPAWRVVVCVLGAWVTM